MHLVYLALVSFTILLQQRNSYICSYQYLGLEFGLFLPIPWFRIEAFFEKRKIMSIRLFMISGIRFRQKFLLLDIQRAYFKICFQNHVFTIVRKRWDTLHIHMYLMFTRHFNMECLEMAVPAIFFLSYAPTFLPYVEHTAAFSAFLFYPHSILSHFRGQ